MPLVVVHAASEVVGFAKTGGLADVAGALPRALAGRGHRCAVILPLYRAARSGKIAVEPTEHTFHIPVGDRSMPGRLWRSQLPGCAVPVYLVEQAEYFERDDPAHGHGLYQFALPGGARRDYPDNCERFAFFSRAVLEALPLLDLWPDVLHIHDWQTGLVPVYLREIYRRHPAAALRPSYDRLRTLFTIHNIAYQGLFPSAELPRIGLGWHLFNHQELEFYGQLNCLKGGVVFADWLTTVSPTYAQEIQTPFYGCGLQGVLAERAGRLVGVVNGVDYRVWDPARDPHIAAAYDAETVGERKPLCKSALQKRYGLPAEPRTPLLGMVARLVEQKGIDLVCRAGEALMEEGCQLVVLGDGDPIYHRMLADLRDRHPRQVGLTLAFDERLAHQVEAGADVFLMPSQYEPSGLNQLYSLRYGTVPVVRATGGLADTITDATPETLAAGTATGFRFAGYTPAAFLGAVQRALNLYCQQPDKWLQLQRTGMGQDWSWERSAAEYEKLYSATAEPSGPE